MKILKQLFSVPSLDYRTQCFAYLTVGLPPAAIASLVVATPGLALSQTSTEVSREVAEPTMMANFFNEILRQTEDAIETVDSVNSILEQITGGDSQPDQTTQPDPETIPQPSVEVVEETTVPSSQPQGTQETNLEVLHQDEAPQLCQMGSEDGTTTLCKEFLVARTGDLLVFTYVFEVAPITFVAPAEPFQQSDTTEGYITGQMRLGDEPIEDMGYCTVGHAPGGSDWGRYSIVNCVAEMGLELSYRR